MRSITPYLFSQWCNCCAFDCDNKLANCLANAFCASPIRCMSHAFCVARRSSTTRATTTPTPTTTLATVATTTTRAASENDWLPPAPIVRKTLRSVRVIGDGAASLVIPDRDESSVAARFVIPANAFLAAGDERRDRLVVGALATDDIESTADYVGALSETIVVGLVLGQVDHPLRSVRLCLRARADLKTAKRPCLALYAPETRSWICRG